MSSTDLPPNISPQLQEQLVKFEQLRKTLEAIPMQRQQVDLRILEILLNFKNCQIFNKINRAIT